MTDAVLIVGAGPVGLTMAVELARYKVPVRIIDRMQERASTSRAVAIWPRTLELLDRSGSSADFIARGNKVTSANIFAGSKLLVQMSIEDVDSPYPFVLMLAQNETEALLEKRLATHGVRCELGAELKTFVQDDDGVTATIAGPDGRIETERFDWLVACDGSHSPVRHGVGLSFEGDTIDTDWGLGDFRISGFPFAVNELVTYWHNEGPLVFFPMEPDRYRLIAALGPSSGKLPRQPSPDEFQAIVDQRAPVGIKLGEPIWTSAFRINERQVPTYRSGRIFLAGDAANVHSPAGGQGMNTGMQDAFNLAWKLALVVRGLSTSSTLLDSFSPERHAVGAEVISASGRLTKLALLNNPIAQDIRNVVGQFMLGLAPVKEKLEAQMTELSTGYPRSILNGPSDGSHARPGTRMRPLDSETPYGSGDVPLFTLRSNEPAPFTHPLVDPILRPSASGNYIELVRPDGYLAMSAQCGNWDAVTAYLRTYL